MTGIEERYRYVTKKIQLSLFQLSLEHTAQHEEPKCPLMNGITKITITIRNSLSFDLTIRILGNHDGTKMHDVDWNDVAVISLCH